MKKKQIWGRKHYVRFMFKQTVLMILSIPGIFLKSHYVSATFAKSTLQFHKLFIPHSYN